MTSVLLDLRYAARTLAKNFGATAVAVFTLALAIGATTAIFSVVYGVLLRPLPYPHPDRLMAIVEVNHRGTYSRLADPNFIDFRDRNHTFSAMAKYTAWVTSIAGMAEPARAVVAMVSKDFFTVLGVQPSLGRGITPDDARIGAAPIAIVSHGLWAQSLGSRAAISDVHVRIEDRVYTVVGVMPPGFAFPAKTDVWVPAELDPDRTSRTAHNFNGIGRLREGVLPAQATAELSAIAKDIIRNSAEQGDYLLADAAAVSLHASLTRRVGSTLYVLLGAVCFLLLIACANVTNLLLAQAAARQRELGIRHALGAGAGRLIRQFVTEALVLLAISCSCGLLIAWAGTNALLSMAPADLPRLEDVSLNWMVMIFAMGLSASVAVVLGLVTAARAARRDPREAFADGARGQAGGASTRRIGRVLVASQMAMTVVLLVGASLLGRSLLRVLSVNPGFRTDGIVAMDLALPNSEEPTASARLLPLYTDLLDRLRAIPGVQEVAVASAVPLAGGLPDGLFAVAGPSDAPKTIEDIRTLFQQQNKLGTADYCAASPTYFRALGIPLVRGRLFDERDGPNAPHVALISESLARARWPDTDPIGATVEFGNMDGDLRLLTIVGIVGDTRESGLEQPPRPTLYVNLLQRPKFSSTVVLRSDLNSTAIVSAARGVVREIAPDVPPRFRTFAQIYSASLGARRFNLTLVAIFAGTALALAVAGIYGVMTYGVTQRRREIGVRVALGAQRGQILRIILGQGLTTTAIGVGIGILAALGLTRTIENLLFGITPTDPVTFAAVIALLAGVSMLACYLPARRATDTDPIQALRQD
jgi:putative ABC transport system permease protein